MGFYDDIIKKASEISPISGTLLQDAEIMFSSDQAELTIQLKKRGVFMLRTCRADAMIEGLAKERYGQDVKVVLTEPDADAIVFEQPVPVIIQPPVKSEPRTVSQEPRTKSQEPRTKSQAPSPKSNGSLKRRPAKLAVKELKGVVTELCEPLSEGDEILAEGVIFRLEKTNTRTGRLMCVMDITDGTDSITVKFFMKDESEFDTELGDFADMGKSVRVLGKVRYDDFAKELTMAAVQIAPSDFVPDTRTDGAPEKRVELHLHTQMSQMDATNSVTDYIKRAAGFGMHAVAVTDHGNVQAFPEAAAAGKKYGVKVIYGMEAYLVDDTAAIVQNPGNLALDDEFVAFDIETTGLDPDKDMIIEIGAVKMVKGEITARFSALIDPGMPLPGKIMKLTGLNDQMLQGQPRINEVMPAFLDFTGDAVLVAHNARFDVGFIRRAAEKIGRTASRTAVCTLELTRALFPELHSHKLNVMAEHCGAPLKKHHRAEDDAGACAGIFLKCREMIIEKGVSRLKDINALGGGNIDVKKLPYHHAIILVKNQTGMRNLYELVSLSNLNYFYKRPRIPKSVLAAKREGLILGTACESGEFYGAVLRGETMERLKELADFYDYIELQTHKNNMYLVREGAVASEDALIALNKRVVELGEALGKPVAATCDVHFLNPGDSIYREIIMAGEGFKDADQQAPLFFRTTREMLDEFSYLSPEKAAEVVITNPRKIADTAENVSPLPSGTFPLMIPGSDEQLKGIIDANIMEMYGANPPETVKQRIELEMDSICKHGFSSLYNAARILTRRSLDKGYLVGSRGSIGSSLAATMSGITEVNPLEAHYYCAKCKFADFKSLEAAELSKRLPGLSGCDLPDKACPVCGDMLKKDGHEIKFEIFLGFDCDKEPDIDLNFSGEYQAQAHAHATELFGEKNVFKAGTIGTLADKTAFGFVNGYLEERGLIKRNAEKNRLVAGLVGVKRTTGQHPGGVIIVPDGHDIHEFCPIQRPADNQDSRITTTHFDYNSALEGRLMKLDILGHDAPTVIRLLNEFTGVDPLTVDLGDKAVISIFNGSHKELGTLGIPEFGTSFVRQMLADTRPNSFTELVKISGLSHGTDVWLGNGADLIKKGVANLNGIVAARDDILLYLVNMGVEKKTAFNIMERVRKTHTQLSGEDAGIMAATGVPEWYIESCRRIKYLFPKGHAVAYVMMSVRIAYYKIHHPLAFYAASYSVKTEDIDYETMCKGPEAASRELTRVNALGRDASAKDKNAANMLELILEMYSRGINFLPIDIYKSHEHRFMLTEKSILPPLMTLAGLGGNAAQNIVEARKDGEFISRQDFKERTKISKTVLELFVKNGLLQGLPETNQLTLDLF